MKRRLFTILSALSMLVLLLSLIYVGDLSQDVPEIREGKLYIPASIDFQPWTRPGRNRVESVQRFLGITHTRHTSHPTMNGKPLRQYTVQDHYIVIDLFWYRIGLLVLPLCWAVSRTRGGFQAGQRRHRLNTGRCPSCGYDLRATPNRCPECGAASAKTAS